VHQTGVSDSAMTCARPRTKRVYGKPRSRTERARFNGRSREGVRLRMLEKQFRAQIGEAADTPVGTLAIRRACELVMLAESQRAAMIRGEAVDLSHLLRLEGVAARAIAALGLPLTRHESSEPSLAEYLSQMSGTEAAENSAGAFEARPAITPPSSRKTHVRPPVRHDEAHSDGDGEFDP
jgi:hypothetical protein